MAHTEENSFTESTIQLEDEYFIFTDLYRLVSLSESPPAFPIVESGLAHHLQPRGAACLLPYSPRQDKLVHLVTFHLILT